MLQIEKNIPIPPSSPIGEMIAVLKTMEVHDSVYTTDEKLARRAVAKAHKDDDARKYITRRVEGGMRVWRTV